MDNINVINSPVVGENWNVFWEEAPDVMRGLEPRDTLVLSVPVPAGSAEMQQLQKMLQACNLTPEAFHLLELPEGKSVAWHKLYEQLRPRRVILLGIEPSDLGISAQLMPHQVNRFLDLSWIPTLSMARLAEYPDIKKHLWNYGLKPVFIEKAFDTL